MFSFNVLLVLFVVYLLSEGHGSWTASYIHTACLKEIKIQHKFRGVEFFLNSKYSSLVFIAESVYKEHSSLLLTDTAASE